MSGSGTGITDGSKDIMLLQGLLYEYDHSTASAFV
jgi:hypothetical protein